MSSTQEVGDIFGDGRGPAQAMLRSPTVLIVSVGLWGMNIFLFNLFRINYRYVLKHDLLWERKREKIKRENSQPKLSTMMTRTNARNSSFDTDDADNRSQHSRSPSSIDSSNLTLDVLLTEDDSHFHDDHSNTSGASITWYKLVAFSISLLFVLHFTTHLWMESLGRSSIGAVFSFYGAVLLYILIPFPSTKWLKRAVHITLQRCLELLTPRFHNSQQYLRPIPFIDVFFADAMCSLSKVFFDWGMMGHMAAHYPDPVPPAAHNIIIPSLCAAVPYLIRARQCWVMLSIGRMKNDPKRYQHLANAIKYSTSLWPLLLSAYQRTLSDEKSQSLEGALIFLLFVNASYSLYWDIVMDWGMMHNPTAVVSANCMGGSGAPMYSEISTATTSSKPTTAGHHHPLSSSSSSCHHGFLRPKLRYGVGISTWIFITDCILRFSWTLRFATHVFPSADMFALFTQFLEVLRRALWNLLRVEWENLKQTNSGTRLIVEDDEDEEDRERLVSTELIDSSPQKAPIRQRADRVE
mmetsp:Transcript_29740/g.71612  ORF Transcript_29740/g.71612 Transcript_29740/m.71612 type:complete len:523 (+) Transcript_29740:240-1808(+)|eukprot:CAMPEP_0113650078 /NCGR_PEP_ID=MMETSP0017_2-20120614/26636_1 /TAXON_ID=2856 /ORGANISM="Cylindrotheca closterium" /LENGTH=522 /DNA_ID=CAMNT_0000562545 /DNA_START=93 /DNA_END=1661 /DNA_ORIENTATION=+ /assembly_acc=CAM_ASM_000147